MKKTLILDSSAIDNFLTCQEYWNLRNLQCLAPAGKPDKTAMYMGTYGHRILETYYHGLASGRPVNQVIEQALSIDPNKDVCKCNHLASQHEHVNNVCTIGRCQCDSFTPVPLDLDKKSIDDVIARVRLYFYQYAQKDVIPNSPESIEIGFSHKLYEDDEKLYVLEGRIDLLGRLGDNKVFLDHKFQMRKRDLFLRSIQFKNYALVTGHHHGIINYVRFAKEVNNDTFKRDITSFSTIDLMLWEKRLKEIFDKALRAKELAEIDGRMDHNWAACSGKFGYACEFSQLCEAPNPQLVQVLKDNFYTKQPEWRPW